jgi:hypothetical protein
MKCFARLCALCIGVVGIVGGEAMAALEPAPVAPAFNATGDVLLANRLRNRGVSFRVSASRYRRGGFSRGSCPEGAAPVVPVAEDDQAAPSYLTASAHPTFLINVPEMTNATGVIYVEDPTSGDRNPQLYKANFDLTDKSGIVGIEMPAEAPALEVGSSYRWRVVINCSPDTGEDNTVVFSGGEVQRVADMEGAVDEQLEYYLAEGIWQETAAILALNRYNQTSATANDEWAFLMEESGLPQYATTPIVAIVVGQRADE